MKTIAVAAFAASLLISGLSVAAAAQLHVKKTASIAASADAVWSKVRDFNGWPAWHPALAADEIVEGKNNVVGAVRVLTLKDGGTIKEKLMAFDESGHTFRYAIIDGVLPVSSYTSTFVVKSTGSNQAMVIWSGTFKRKNTGANPAETENDKAATDTISGVYQSGLDNLKTVVEAK